MVTFPFIFTYLNLSENPAIHSENSGLPDPSPSSQHQYPIYKKCLKPVLHAKEMPILPTTYCRNRGLQNTCRMAQKHIVLTSFATGKYSNHEVFGK